MSKSINLIFPNQLFENHPLLEIGGDIYLMEEHLFFQEFKFHKQKIAFHRASMKTFQNYLEAKGAKVIYVQSGDELSDIRNFLSEIEKENIVEINVIAPTDNWLQRRLEKVCKNIKLNILDSPQFINNKSDLAEFFNPEKKSYFQTAFYKQERIRLHILMSEDGKPEGEKWTFDAENRKKYPKNKTPPPILFPQTSAIWQEAVKYTGENFKIIPANFLKIQSIRFHMKKPKIGWNNSWIIAFRILEFTKIQLWKKKLFSITACFLPCSIRDF